MIKNLGGSKMPWQGELCNDLNVSIDVIVRLSDKDLKAMKQRLEKIKTESHDAKVTEEADFSLVLVGNELSRREKGIRLNDLDL